MLELLPWVEVKEAISVEVATGRVNAKNPSN